MKRLLLVVFGCALLAGWALPGCQKNSRRGWRVDRDEAIAIAHERCLAAGFRTGGVVKIKLSGQRAVVTALLASDIHYYSAWEEHPKGPGYSGWWATPKLKIRTAGHYGNADQWSIEKRGWGGSTGGSEGAMSVNLWEVEPTDESIRETK